MKKIYLLALALVLSSLCFSINYYVNPSNPAYYNTIQSAIDQAFIAGGVANICVENPLTDGSDYIYNENLTVNFQLLTLNTLNIKNTSLPNHGAITISGDSDIGVINVTGVFAESINFELSGFTITNTSCGNGVNLNYMSSDVVLINNCNITGNYNGINLFDSMPYIENCSISNNTHIGINDTWNWSTTREDICVINSNISNNGNKGLDLEYGWDIINCTIIGNGTIGLFGNRYFNVNNCIIRGNITQIHFISDYYVQYSNIQSGFAGFGNIDENPLFVDPLNDDYQLTQPSPCIDAGDPSSPIDPDGTITDMGCYYYLQEVDNRDFSGSEWNWISFPRLRVDENDEALSWKVLTILQPQLPSYITTLDGVTSTSGQTYDGSIPQWDPVGYTFDRISGYKINCPYASDLTLTVPGERVSEDTHVTLYPNQENWVGYFCESSSSPERALESIWDDFQLVKHQNWSYYRLTPGGTVYKLLTSGSVRPGFHYGDMAVIKTFNQAILIWNYDNALVMSHPVSEVFSYEEKADYTPIHVELETGSDVAEVGIFVNDECIGFGVVTEDESMIRAYLDETRNGDGELEFVYYNEDRSQNHISDYCVYDEKLQVMVNRKINSAERRDFYNVSLRKDGSSSNTPKPELTMNAYPNPFNPTTNISFYAPETENVKVEIFNIKGQKIKTLFDGIAHSGKNLLVWKGMNDSKQPVASGLYFCKISTNKETIKQKLMLLK